MMTHSGNWTWCAWVPSLLAALQQPRASCCFSTARLLLTRRRRRRPPPLPLARFRVVVCYSGTRFHCVMRDLSDAKRVETSLQDFLATTSHDARTPLNSIQAAAALLRERTLTKEAAELLSAISASARVLTMSINNVMRAKRLDQGGCDVSPGPVAIRVLVAETCATARDGLAQQAGTSVVWEETPLPELIVSRGDDLSHLLLNVVCFCVQAADGSAVRVHASCDAATAADAAGRTHVLLLRVAFGRALSEDAIATAFDPYVNLTGDWLDEGRGSGRLGLHVAQRLARALGGDLVVTAAEAEGTAFIISIPVSLGDDAAPPRVASPAGRAEPPAAATPPPQQPQAPPPPSGQEREAEVDLGLLPYIPPGLVPSESIASIQRRGLVTATVDLLLANTPDSYFVGEGPYVRYLSPGAIKMLRYDCAEEAPTLLADLLHPDDAAMVMERVAAAEEQCVAQDGIPVQISLTFRCVCKGGGYIWKESRVCVTPTHIYAVSADVTERVQREASMRGFLASVMADMRTPLTSVQAASELLAARMCVRNDEESAFLVAAISSGCTMLAGIVSNVMSCRSIETGECVVEAAPCSVRAVVTNVLSVCRMSLAHRSDVRIEWADETDTTLPPCVLCDKRLLSHILLNLLTSACALAMLRVAAAALILRLPRC